MLGVLLVLLVANAAAQASAVIPSGQPCCTSNQFTAEAAVTVGKQVDGKGVAEQGTQMFMFDYTNKMVYVESSMTNIMTQVTSTYKVLQDFNKMQQYVTWEDGNCYVQPWNEPIRPPCIPDNATFLGEVTLNQAGAALKGNSFEFTTGNASTKMIVSQDTCTPLVEVSAGWLYGEEQQRSTLFYNFMPSVNASFFVVPANCKPMRSSPVPCCTSKQFTASVAVTSGKEVNGHGVASKGMQRLVFDSINRMVYTESNMVDQETQTQTNLKVVQDYNNMKQYITLEDGTCYVQPWDEVMAPPCIPDSATFLGELTLGEGASALKAYSFEFVAEMSNVTMVVARDTCTPISETRVGRFYGEDQQRTSLYYNFMPSISDADKANLAVPANCTTPCLQCIQRTLLP